MTKLESLDQLRELAADINASEIVDHMELYPSCVFDGHWLDAWHRQFDKLLEAIQAEIDSRYMELPVDAENVPLHLNDEVVSLDTNAQLVVTGIADDAVQVSCFSVWERGDHFVHVKPRTVEDVLLDLTNEVARQGHQIGLTANEIIAKYAAELQMRGDAE